MVRQGKVKEEKGRIERPSEGLDREVEEDKGWIGRS